MSTRDSKWEEGQERTVVTGDGQTRGSGTVVAVAFTWTINHYTAAAASSP